MMVTVVLIGAGVVIGVGVPAMILLLTRPRPVPAPVVRRFVPAHPPELAPMTARIAIGELPPDYRGTLRP